MCQEFFLQQELQLYETPYRICQWTLDIIILQCYNMVVMIATIRLPLFVKVIWGSSVSVPVYTLPGYAKAVAGVSASDHPPL